VLRTLEAGVVTVIVAGGFCRIISANSPTSSVTVRRRFVAVTVTVGGEVATPIDVTVTVDVIAVYALTVVGRVIRRAVVVTSVVDSVLGVRTLKHYSLCFLCLG